MPILCSSHYIAYLSEVYARSGVSAIQTRQQWTKRAFSLHASLAPIISGDSGSVVLPLSPKIAQVLCERHFQEILEAKKKKLALLHELRRTGIEIVYGWL